MKESITKFDLESAFKALDEIDIPVTSGVRANRPALTEIFSRKSKLDTLVEEYYDISSAAELDDAKEAREAEVAKAKLARIEKIVDLDAESPEDLLTSYVGKYIMQCPQCMTLFYKDPEDVVEAEDDPDTVNVNEVCQHCGNEAGYTLIGKVGEAAPGEFTEETPELEATEEMPTEEASSEETYEEATDESAEDLENLEDLDLDLDLEGEGEEKKEESFTAHEGYTLVEELVDDSELDAKLEAHDEYIDYLRAAIAQEEKSLEKTTNEQVKVAIQRNIDAFKADLENALPDAVKNDMALPEEATDETTEETPTMQEESCAMPADGETLTEALQEASDLDISADEFEELINSPEFKKPISDAATRAMIATEEPKAQDAPEEPLTEGNLLDLGKAFTKKLGQGFKNLKNKASAAIDKFVDNVKTREEKADWLLANTLDKSVKEVNIDDKGNIITDENDQKFKVFLVIGFKDHYSNGKKITMAPSFSNKDLVIGMQEAQEKTSYKEADAVAKGWSMQQGNGPAFIYLAKNSEDPNAAFLCEYFEGKLANDQLEKYFENVRKDIAGKIQTKKGGGVQGEHTNSLKTEETSASALKPGDQIVFGEETAEVAEVAKSKFGTNSLAIKIKVADGSLETINVDAAAKVALVVKSDAKESFSITPSALKMIMENLDEINESALETQISDSLVEAYGNVAGYQLTDCEYLDEKLKVDGTVYFTSGNTRKITYTFAEAYIEKENVKLCGLNEKLGLDKKFILTGKIDTLNKTLITESFGNK